MRGKGTDKKLGAQVMALNELNKTQEEIGQLVGLPQTTVSEILTGKGRWASIQREAWFETYRKSQKRKIEAAAHELSEQALRRIEETLPKANLSQASVTFGILQDKIRLLAGESTANVAVAVKVEADALNKTLDKLLKGLRE